jgi:hypothetical protein
MELNLIENLVPSTRNKQEMTGKKGLIKYQ